MHSLECEAVGTSGKILESHISWLLILALCEPVEEYTVIASYLALPSRPADLFTNEILQIITYRCSDKRVMQAVAQGRSPIMSIDYPLSVNLLIDLPEDYSDLINSASLFM